MPTRDVCDMSTAFEESWYSTTTGAFSPRSAMRNVEFNVSLIMTGGAPTDVTTFQLLVGGTQVDSGTVLGATPRIVLRASRVPANVNVVVNVQSSASRSASGSSSNRMTITGSL